MKEDVKEKILLDLRRGSREVFEHEPRELFISINGDIKLAQEVGQNLTDFKIEFDETPEFIEIFSEQDIRLAFLSFAEDSAQLEQFQQFTFNFSEERKLLLNLKKESSKIILDAVYENPNFETRDYLPESFAEEMSFDEFLEEIKPAPIDAPIFGALLDSKQKDKNSLIEKLKNLLVPSFVGFKTAFAGGFAAFAIAAFLIVKLFVFVPSVSATEIIEKAVNAEQLNENDTERVVYRVLNFEEKNADGTTVKKRRIEIFNDAVRKLSVKRLFDENNRLIAGQWRRTDGVSTFYTPGKMSELRLNQTDSDIINKDLENIWQLSVSAKGFESLIGLPENVTVEHQNDEYQVNYLPKSENGITRAVLFINQNLRTNKLLLTVRQNDTAHEFSFTEATFEQKPRANVEKTVFEPNSEFLKNTLTASKNNPEIAKTEKSLTEPEAVEPSQPSAVVASPSASAEIEVKVLQLLNSVNALSGEQINITKTPDGRIQVKGIVDAKNRKDEILNALSEVRGNSSISINIQTAEEAAKNKPTKPTNGTLESITVESKNSIPASDILRTHFAGQGLSEEKTEAEIRRFASASLAKSSQVRRSALQMKQIAERFSPAELEKMDEATKNNWRKLIKQNAAALAQSSEGLRGDLRALNIDAGNGGGNVNAASDAELVKTAKRLFELSLAIDRDMRASFSAGGNRGSVPVKSAGFANNLGEIIGLAKQLR